MLYMAQPTFPLFAPRFAIFASRWDELAQPEQTTAPSNIPSGRQAVLCDITRSRWKIGIDPVIVPLNGLYSLSVHLWSGRRLEIRAYGGIRPRRATRRRSSCRPDRRRSGRPGCDTARHGRPVG